MILVTGGAYSGKTTFIKNKFDLAKYEHIESFDKLIIDLLKEDESLSSEEITKQLLKNRDAKNLIVEIRQVGCGIVPIDKFERLSREVIGRCSCILADMSESVYETVCGVAKKIK